ncbi:putative prolyl 4-hydroxylase 4, partial [Cucurbita argyrosperma subsp. argyrosperma]
MEKFCSFNLLFFFSLSISLLLRRASSSYAGSASSIVNPAKVKQISWNPRAFVYEGFLTDLESDHLISIVSRIRIYSFFICDTAVAKAELKRSAVADNLSGESKVSEIRTSSGAFIKKSKDPIVSGIEDKIAAWTFLPKVQESQRRQASETNEDLSDCAKKGIAVKPRKGDALLFFSLHPNAVPDTSLSFLATAEKVA